MTSPGPIPGSCTGQRRPGLRGGITHVRSTRHPLIILSVIMLAVGCAGPQSTTPQSTTPAHAARTLRIGEDPSHEPSGGLMLDPLAGRGGTGAVESQLVFHAGLTVFDQNSNLVAHLAQKVPSLDNGDWVIFPDG